MIETTALWEMKARMQMAAAAAATLVGQDEPLSLDEATYLLVTHALEQLPDDLRVLCAELDVLRGSVTSDWSHMFGARNNEDADGSGTSASSMEEVRSGGIEDGGSGATDGNPATGGAVRRKRVNRKKAGRPDSEADRGAVSGDTVAVE